MLAYSSIAHAGYLLVGLVAADAAGYRSILFYLLAYAMMTLGALAVVQVVARRGEVAVDLEDYAGLGFRFPAAGVALSVCLFSLAGIPLTAGFAGKFFLLAAAVERGFYGLVVIAVLASAVGVYYYLRVMVYMYMRVSAGGGEAEALPAVVRIVLILCTAGTLFFGVFPQSLLKLASEVMNL
jgi:NADH-quinone oxidoreductase subunit N